MKVLAARKFDGGVSVRMAPDDAVLQPGEVLVSIPAGTEPAVWAAQRIWDDAAGAPRLPFPAEILAKARADQEDLVRDAANAEHLSQVRPFEADIVAAKYGRGGLPALNAEETIIFNNMNTRYNKLLGLVTQVRSAPIETVKTINW